MPPGSIAISATAWKMDWLVLKEELAVAVTDDYETSGYSGFQKGSTLNFQLVFSVPWKHSEAVMFVSITRL